MFEKNGSINLAAINFVEFIADTQHDLDNRISCLEKQLLEKQITFHLTENQEDMDNLWKLRKEVVGLLGEMKGERKPIPFIEDTTVAPQILAEI